ncbi:hypothetical protein GALMADRAFT_75007 [Galerina marginata CBS 339.88]|uniref:MutL C-terminal dimerisation domain-containing protein n=1 Tax=Galerina marginata (strain CBS 339.88) TaxID=685588 RepID=A0A067SL11_GALM3|nr:hypothetical protein GALMADRAFT_75007 [Galerina marginata CBS 339.88]
MEDDEDADDPTSVLSQARASTSTTRSTTSYKDRISHPEIIKTDKDGRDVFLKFDADRIKNAWSKKLHQRRRRGGSGNGREQVPGPESVPVDAGISNTESDAKAVDALARVIEKKDFAEMEVVGQFNLGFVVVRRQKGLSITDADSVGVDHGDLDDLFIIDQHAADEKYNFETLQATTKIQSQKLFRPRPLELTASDEMLALENMGILRQNGFEIDVEEEQSVGQGSRLKLTAQPVSKSTVFDMKDLEEIIHLMRDRPGGQMVRCSKARAMFAMRACRKSVMVGMPLNQHQMTTVIRHMGTMDQPWNCPHGRPTMRHLSDIRTSGSKSREGIDWSSIC